MKIQDFIFGSPGTFLTKRTIGNREYYLSVPGNFNNKVVILMHGATGSADSIIKGDVSSRFIVDLMSSGFGIIMPDARKDFAMGTPLYPRWETESEQSLDTGFINLLIHDVKKIIYGSWVRRIFRPAIKVIVGGGSSGAIMATRAALAIGGITGIFVLNGVSAQCVALDPNDGHITFDLSKISIPENHPPVFAVTGLNDTVLPWPIQNEYKRQLVNNGIDCVSHNFSNGDHFWGEWVIPAHSWLISWMLRL